VKRRIVGEECDLEVRLGGAIGRSSRCNFFGVEWPGA